MPASGKSFEDKFFTCLAIGLFILIGFVIPVAAFVFDPHGIGLPVLILGLTGFLYAICSFLGFDDNRWVSMLMYVSLSVGIILFLRFVFLYIRDLFVADPRSGLAEMLAIPVAAVVYGLVIWLLPEKAGEGERKVYLKMAKLVSILVISGLVYLIYR